MKTLLKSLLESTGYEVRHKARAREHQPWGVDMEIDLQRLLGRPIRNAIDIGANLGQTAQELSEHFPAAAIHSFEPIPDTFEKMKQNVAHLSNVTPHCVAMSASRGEGSMRTFDADVNATMADDVWFPSEEKGRVKVKTDTVDGFMADQGIEQLDLLKIDTEGFEMTVLQGCERVLAEGRVEAVFAEFFYVDNDEPKPGTTLFGLNDFLAQRGMYLANIYTDRVMREGWFYGLRNALFIKWRPEVPVDDPTAKAG